MELISVITTAYNAEVYIDETIHSILRQDYENFEFIIVDDGSTDRTVEKIEQFSDHRICLIKAGRVGRGKALNMAIEASHGDYIAIQDADDLSHPQRFSIEIQYLKALGDKGLIGASQVVFYNEDSPKWSKECASQKEQDVITECQNSLLYFNPISHTSLMIPKKLLDTVGRYDQSRAILFDWDLYLRVAALGYGIYQLSIPLVGKRLHNYQYFERKKRLNYLIGSLKLQFRAAVQLKKYGAACLSIPFLFIFRLLPVNLRISVRPFIKSFFKK